MWYRLDKVDPLLLHTVRKRSESCFAFYLMQKGAMFPYAPNIPLFSETWQDLNGDCFDNDLVYSRQILISYWLQNVTIKNEESCPVFLKIHQKPLGGMLMTFSSKSWNFKFNTIAYKITWKLKECEDEKITIFQYILKLFFVFQTYFRCLLLQFMCTIIIACNENCKS